MSQPQRQPLNIQPGLYTLETDVDSISRWKDGDKIRFYRGMPQKLGGWQKNGSQTFLGKARTAIDWLSLRFEKFIALGTHLKLYVWNGGDFSDITPLRSTDALTDPFTTTNGSTTVSVEHVAHGALDGDYVTYSGATAVGGVTIDGEYQLTYVDDDHYTITHSAAAGSSATGGGSVSAEYQVHVGRERTMVYRGWGAGPWSGGTWGTPRSVTNFLTMARIWSLSNWGEDLIACYRNGGIYLWDSSAGTGTRAATISGAPSTAVSVFVSEENRQLVVLGAHDGSNDDPMLIRWSASEDYSDFTPTDLNTAGRKRLDKGNELYGRVGVKNGNLIFSDAWIWLMTFDGPPYTFGFLPLGDSGGIRSPNAMKELGGNAYWMGKQDFFIYDGGSPRVLPCDVLNHVFDDFNQDQSALVFAGANRAFGEIWWLYPSANSNECDRYVAYSTVENHWTFGTLGRTVYVADSKIFANSYALGTDGYLYDHDFGVDDDGAGMEVHLESGDIMLSPGGEDMMHLSGAIPNFKRLTGEISLVLKGRREAQDPDQFSTPAQTITSSTKKVSPRMRARQIAVRIESSGVGDDFRMGRWRVLIQPDGKK